MDFAPDYADFVQTHLPNLHRYVIGIAHESDDGESLGSGVFVNLNGRHFIATAKHCIERDPRVMFGGFVVRTNDARTQARFEASRPIRILNADWHPDLDIGFLEIQSASDFEVTEEQLCFTTQAVPIHVIGHPVSRMRWNKERMEVVMDRCCFSTKATESAPTYFKMEYPKTGTREVNGQWVRGIEFPDAHGFSGGGCFAVSKTNRSGLEIIEYQLLGIECSWHSEERWVKATPIKQWLDLVKQHL